MAESPVCAHCQSAIDAENAVHLWDGKDYCRTCVEDACEGMADYAGEHPVLEETLPFLLRKFLRAAFATTMLNVLIVCAVLCMLAPDGSLSSNIVMVLAVPGPVVAFCSILYFLLYWLMTRKRRETIQVVDAVVGIQRPVRTVRLFGLFTLRSDAEPLSRTSPLSECRWYVWRFRRPRSSLRLDSQLVCLLLRAPFLGLEDPEQTRYCGHDPEMLAIWQGFLTLAGVGRPLGLWETWWQPPERLRGGKYAAARRAAST